MKYAVCYDTLYVFQNKKDLDEYFTECCSFSEGAERERYVSILINSASKEKISSDFVSNDCREVVIKDDKHSDQYLTYKLDKRLSINDTVKYFEETIKPILDVSKEYDINFLNKIPFEDFGNDTESAYGGMYSFSNYYKDILEKFLIEVKDITTDDKSDGKYIITINNGHEFDASAWDKFDVVVDNVESMLETLKNKDMEVEM